MKTVDPKKSVPAGSPAHVGRTQRVVVFVQGELAQSPRMLNHARMMLAEGWTVVLAGYANVPLPADLLAHPRLTVRAIGTSATRRLPRLPHAAYLIVAFARACAVAAASVTALLRAGAADVYLVQNPPAVPALPIARAIAALRRASVVLDWHNTSTSVLAFRLGDRHPLVRMLNLIERRFARAVRAHLCVSGALRDELAARWTVTATVVHDRPLRYLPRIGGDVRRDVFQRLLRLLDAPPLGTAEDPAVIVSPSSWSLEEDMELLLDALKLYAAFDEARPILVFATGMGPGRAPFERRAVALANPRMRIVTGWLDEDAYAELLQVADTGVCLHRSTSCLDLPMKLVDFAAAGVPALAFGYGDVLHELPVRCATFQSAAELARALHERAGSIGPVETVADQRTATWDDEWRVHALPVLSP